MNSPNEIAAAKSPFRPADPRADVPRGFVFASVILLIASAWPLYRLARFSLSSELYSHIVLIPFISVYLVWQLRTTLPAASSPNRPLAVIFFVVGLALLVGYALAAFPVSKLPPDDSLALTTLAFLALFGGICAWFLGRRTLRAICFPLGFLIFMVPMPVALVAWIESLLQQGSAAAARPLFALAGTTVFYQNLTFQLPGISLEVAPECSGIRSTLALFITSLLVGHFFLRSPWKCALLAAAVIPLGLARNGLRIFTIGELCVRIGPEMIDSYIHRHGGPVFFAVTLIPFFLLVYFLVKWERAGARAEG